LLIFEFFEPFEDGGEAIARSDVGMGNDIPSRIFIQHDACTATFAFDSPYTLRFRTASISLDENQKRKHNI
jgi:hypothetical protein